MESEVESISDSKENEKGRVQRVLSGKERGRMSEIKLKPCHIGGRINGGNPAYKRNESDFYPTPPEVTQALLNFLKIDKTKVIWEPACGEGHMVNVMKDYGYDVIATDIKTGTDYLSSISVMCDWIITNPPFRLSEDFIKKSIEMHKPFALLLKSQYFHAARRLSLFNQFKPQFILPLTWRPDFLFKTRGKGSPCMDMIWVVWGEETSEKTLYIPLKKPNMEQEGRQ